MAIFGHPIEGSWRRARMRRLSSSLLNKIENDINQWHTCWTDQDCQGIWSPAIRLDVSRIIPEFAYPPVPNRIC
jgi:hypothetical protein